MKKFHGLLRWMRWLALAGLMAGAASSSLAAKTYSDNGDGTVTDPTTGLTWMRCAMGQTWSGTTCTGTASTYTFGQANALTGTVTFAGQSDWRLPNIRELQTIVDRTVYNPAIDSGAFPSLSQLDLVSSSRARGYTGYVWHVSFYDGISSFTGEDQGSVYQVRLVRAGLSLGLLDIARPSTDYVMNNDGTAVHTPTRLIWQRCAVGQDWTGSNCSGIAGTYSWDQAKLLTSNLAGKTDWRLPSEEELLSLVDYGRFYPAANPALFPNAPDMYRFWSSSPSLNGSANAWQVYFRVGSADGLSARNDYNGVRLVRSGQSFGSLILTVTKTGVGQVNSSVMPGIECGELCSGGYNPGDVVTLSATSAGNFISWGGACASNGTAASCSITMNAAKTVIANFKDMPVVGSLPSALAFTAQDVTTSSTAQSVTLSNTGTATMNISSISATGDFAVSHNCGAGIGAGVFCTLNVVFSPTASGTRTGTITLTSDATNSPHIVALTGTGQSGTSVVSTSALTFSSQGIGSVSVAKTLTLSNNGRTELNIASISTTGSFASTTTCGTKLAAGSQCSINVTFNPTEVGSLTGTAVISSDAYSSPTTVNLSGIGVAVSKVALHPTELSFAASTLGTSSAVETITLTNSGGASLTLNGAAVTGDFSQVNNCGGGLSAGASCNIRITFTPTVMGSHTGTLALISNALGSPHSVALTGGPVATSLVLAKGWNLLGNGMDQPLSVATLFGDPLNVTTVWKWDVANAGWQFYAPSMDAAALQSYATVKNYGVLSNINAGEGFWVNAVQPFVATVPSGIAISGNDFQIGKPHAPKPGWNLVAIGNSVTPSAFNVGLGTSPPSPGVVPINLTTLWAWDNPQGKWYFYAPNLEGQGGTALTDYITGKAYLDFTTGSKKIGPGVGFWVNKP